MRILGLRFFLVCSVLAVFLYVGRTQTVATIALEYNTDRPGQDYKGLDLTAADPNLCREECVKDQPRCRAFSYVKPGVQGPGARCYLKSPAPKPVANACCTSGVVPEQNAVGAEAGAASAAPAAFALKPMDLEPMVYDLNGLPFNPKWAYQLSHSDLPNPNKLCFRPWPGLPPGGPLMYQDPRGLLAPEDCTTQKYSLDAGFLCASHVNWGVATYDGTVYWDSKSSVGTDDDYNFWLQRPDQAGWTSSDPTGPQLEFDSDETIDHFHSYWWGNFHHAVDTDNWPARVMVDNKYAIVIGLVGIDCVHSCGAELHPVYGMAIKVQDDPADETWVFFARNWGDEGFCSDSEHMQPFTSLKFLLPWRKNADSFNTISGTEFNEWLINSDYGGGGTNAGIQWAKNEGISVEFDLPPANAFGLIEGELHIQWNGAGVGDPCGALRAQINALLASLSQVEGNIPANKAGIPGVVAHNDAAVLQWHQLHDHQMAQLQQQLASCEGRTYRPPAVFASMESGGPVDAEAEVEGVVGKMSQQQQEAFSDKLGAHSVSARQVMLPPLGKPVQVTKLAYGPRLPIALGTSVPNKEKQARDRQRVNSICQTMGSNVFKDPKWCQQN